MEACCYQDTCCGYESGRRFLTKEEKIQRLRSYKEALDKEANAVNEIIEDLNQ